MAKAERCRSFEAVKWGPKEEMNSTQKGNNFNKPFFAVRIDGARKGLSEFANVNLGDARRRRSEKSVCGFASRELCRIRSARNYLKPDEASKRTQSSRNGKTNSTRLKWREAFKLFNFIISEAFIKILSALVHGRRSSTAAKLLRNQIILMLANLK